VLTDNCDEFFNLRRVHRNPLAGDDYPDVCHNHGAEFSQLGAYFRMWCEFLVLHQRVTQSPEDLRISLPAAAILAGRPLGMAECHELLVGEFTTALVGLLQQVADGGEVDILPIRHFNHSLNWSEVLWSSHYSLLHVAVQDRDNICTALNPGDYTGLALEATVWHTLLLGSIKYDCDAIALGIGMHYTIDENAAALGLFLLQDATGTLTSAVCSLGH